MSEATVKKEPGTATLVLVLFAISAVVALLLGVTNMVTKPFIDENARKAQEKAMQEVLPSDSYEQLSYTGGDGTVDAIYSAGDAGYVVQVTPATSFSGTLSVMVGVDPDGACTGISIVATGETSGLGSNASKPVFKDQFPGVSGTVNVTKDGGAINAITGATITSRGVCEAVTSALAAAASMG